MNDLVERKNSQLGVLNIAYSISFCNRVCLISPYMLIGIIINSADHDTERITEHCRLHNVCFKYGVRIPFNWWTWRESNPRPNILPSQLLPSQPFYWNSLARMRKGTPAGPVASSIRINGQSLPYTVSRDHDARIRIHGEIRADERTYAATATLLLSVKFRIPVFNAFRTRMAAISSVYPSKPVQALMKCVFQCSAGQIVLKYHRSSRHICQ